MWLRRYVALALRYALITLMSALLAVMTVQIVLRYGFNSSLLWAEELCRYMLIWLAFLAGASAFARGELAALGVLGDALPRVPALLLACLGVVLSMGLCGTLVYYGWRYADLAGGSAIPAVRFILEDLFGANAPPSPGVFWVYLALPVGMGLIFLRLVADLAICLRALGRGETLDQALNRSAAEPGR